MTQPADLSRYSGYGRYDMAAYLQCRKRIAMDYCPEHHRKLKAHYRRAFLNNPFRKGFK